MTAEDVMIACVLASLAGFVLGFSHHVKRRQRDRQQLVNHILSYYGDDEKEDPLEEDLK